MIIEQTEFKGRPTITIKFDENDRYPFSFGVGKAKKMLGALEEIKAFVEKHDTYQKPETPQEEQSTSEPIPEQAAEDTPEETQEAPAEESGTEEEKPSSEEDKQE